MPSHLNPRRFQIGPWLLALVLVRVTTLAATNVSSWIRLPWSSADGLPNNTVHGLAQTADGFLWLGTPNGLARFDGVRFEEVPTTNIIAMPHRGVVAMTASRDGGLHLGTDRGAVISLNTRRHDVLLPDKDLTKLMIYSLIEDVEGAVWACYRNGSVRRVVRDRSTAMGQAEGFPEGVGICSMTCEPDGRLWFLKQGKLGVWRGNQFEVLQQIAGRLGRVAAAGDGGVWACVDFRLHKFSEGGVLSDHGSFRPRLPGTEVSVMLESRNGILWIGTTFSGLYCYDGRSFETVATTHQEITSLLEDAEGNIWVGMGGGGLNQVRPRAVTLEATEAGLPVPAVSSLCEDREGVIWAAMQNGALARNVGGRWSVIPNDATWAGDAMAVAANPAGGIWVGTRSHRLQRWLDGKFVAWGDAGRMKSQTIHTLVVATNNDLWLGEDSPVMVQRLRNGVLQDFEVPPEVRVIRASAQDAAGNVWFGDSQGA